MNNMKERVYWANMELVKRGLVIYTWGNVSEIDREQGVVAIKPRGIDYDKLAPEDIVVVDLQGKVIEGKLLPSVDLDIHLVLYRELPEVGGIAHTHSTWATAWAQALTPIPVLGTTHADHFCGAVICTRPLESDEINRNYEEEIGNVIIQELRQHATKDVNAVLVGNHGPFTWGKDADQAVENSVILEEVAKMASLTLSVNPKTQPISAALLDKHYSRKFGPNSYFYQAK